MEKRAVLFVDDEVNILNSLRRGLIDEEYECLFANSGKEALDILGNKEISVLVTDMKMPEMDGLTLLKIVKEKYPQTVRIVLSGYTQLQQILATVNQVDIFKFITKPWKMEDEFKHIIRQALDYYNLQVESGRLKKALERKNHAYQKMLQKMEKMISYKKKDMLDLQEIGEGILFFLDERLYMDKKDWQARMEFSKKIFTSYAEAISSQSEEINLNDFLEENIKKWINLEEVEKLDSHITKNATCTIQAKLEVLQFFVEILLKTFFLPEHKFYVKVNIDLKEETEKIVLEITLFTASLLAEINEKEQKLLQDKIALLKLVLQHLFQSLENSLAIHNVENKAVAKVNLSFRKIIDIQ